jgi:hypothetical protein
MPSIECVPGLSVDVVRVATPPFSGAEPRVVEEVRSLKITLPVGNSGRPGEITVAVNVTASHCPEAGWLEANAAVLANFDWYLTPEAEVTVGPWRGTISWSTTITAKNVTPPGEGRPALTEAVPPLQAGSLQSRDAVTVRLMSISTVVSEGDMGNSAGQSEVPKDTIWHVPASIKIELLGLPSDVADSSTTTNKNALCDKFATRNSSR